MYVRWRTCKGRTWAGGAPSLHARRFSAHFAAAEDVEQVVLWLDRRAAVGQIVLRFGYTRLGAFARAYRRCFGETALETPQPRR